MTASSSHQLVWFYGGVFIALGLFLAGLRSSLLLSGGSAAAAAAGSPSDGTASFAAALLAFATGGQVLPPGINGSGGSSFSSWYTTPVAIIAGLCLSIGAAQLLLALARTVQFVVTQFCRPALDLEARYGSGSWAVVTGASAGIGLGFAVELAKRNFNIVLISRSVERLRAAEAEVQAARKGVLTRIVAVDFKDCGGSEFWDNLVNEHLADIDISILINNVGINHTEAFTTIPERFLLDVVPVNCTSQLMMTRRLINRLVDRTSIAATAVVAKEDPSTTPTTAGQPAKKLRSAIVSVSSVAGQRPLLYLAPYSATKAFNDFFSRALALEFGDRIDVLSLRPGYVVSNMSKLTDKGGFVLDRYECASGCLEKLGHVNETYGDPRHAIYARSFFLLPEFVLCRRRHRRLQEKNAAIASADAAAAANGTA